MKSMILVALALVAVAVALPADVPVEIVNSQVEQLPDGSYRFSYETSDGSIREETGELRQIVDAENKPQTVVVVRGSYRYIQADGTPNVVTYSADENGYQAAGDSIPKPARR